MRRPSQSPALVRVSLGLAGVLGLLSLLLLGTVSSLWAAGDEPATVVFLVRHAEKVPDGSRDQPLLPEGEERAKRLADLLHHAQVSNVWSTDFQRTRDTASPLADGLGLDVELYDPRELEALAETLRATPGRHLVVGHSNTTPKLVELLGGEGGPKIEEKAEYGRLYVLVLGSKNTQTVRLTY